MIALSQAPSGSKQEPAQFTLRKVKPDHFSQGVFPRLKAWWYLYLEFCLFSQTEKLAAGSPLPPVYM